MDLPEIPATGAFRIVWVPESFLFHANANYESIWKAHSVLPGEVQPASEASPPVSEVLEGAELIPLDQTSPPIVPTNRRAERQKVREARLRAALAHVRAERLAAKYYQKYGQYQPADDESSLSVESEFEDELEDFRKI
jgi:hypothetical protein